MGPWMMCIKLYSTWIYINVSNEIVIDRIELVIFPTFPIESHVHFPWGWNERDKGGQECLVIDNAELLRIHHCSYATLSVLIWKKANGFAQRVLVWIYLFCCIYICFSMAKPNLVRRKYACYKERESVWVREKGKAILKVSVGWSITSYKRVMLDFLTILPNLIS